MESIAIKRRYIAKHDRRMARNSSLNSKHQKAESVSYIPTHKLDLKPTIYVQNKNTDNTVIV